MGIRNKAAVRYIAALLAILPGLFLILISISPAFTSILSQYGYYYNTPIYAILSIIYFFAFLEGLLILFPAKHAVAGILLMIEAVLAFLISAQSTNMPFGLIAAMPLVIGGILAILYKPIGHKLASFPKKARRLISTAGYVIFLALLIDISSKIVAILLLQSSLRYQSLDLQTLIYPAALIVAFLIAAILIFVAILFVSFNLKTDNPKQISKYSKVAAVVGAITILAIVVISSLFERYGISFITANFASVASGSMASYSLDSGSLAVVITLVAPVELTLLVIGLIMLFLGSLSGLAYSEKIGIIKYASINRKFVVYPIIALILLYILFSYYSGYQTSSDNKLALASLNGRIQMYGGNLRYMLANQTAYNDALAGTNTLPTNSTYLQAEGLYKSLVTMANPQSNISSIFTFGAAALRRPGLQSSSGGSFLGSATSQTTLNTPTNQELSQFDWYRYNPFIRLVELTVFYSLGFQGGASSNLPDYNNLFLEHQNMIIPRKVSPLQSIYELNGYGLDILLIAQELIYLFHSNYLRSAPSTYTVAPANNIGVGIGMLTYGGGTYATTTLLNGSFYDIVSGSQLSNGWIAVSTAAQSIRMEGFPEIDNSTYTNNLFYAFSLGQYSTYYISEIFYNRTIEPNIDFFGYLNNTIILNLGNLDLANPQITLYIDGNRTKYVRHYNYLIVYNKHLNTGYHRIAVTISNMSLSASVYISPILLSYPLLSPRSYQNGNYANNGSLSFEIYNPYQFLLNVTNLSVSGGVSPEPSIVPTNISAFTYNWSASYTAAPVLVNATYSRFAGYVKLHNNYTNTNYTQANYATSDISANTPYSIDNLSFVTVRYSVPTCTVGDVRYYTVTFDTDYGVSHDILSVKCI